MVEKRVVEMMKEIRHNRKVRLYYDEGYPEPYVLEQHEMRGTFHTNIRVHNTYKTLAKALSAYKSLSKRRGVRVH